MPRDPVELVSEICASWGRGDFSAADWADPEIVVEFADGMEAGTHRGTRAMAEQWRAWLSEWEDFRVEAEDVYALDAERVMVVTRFHGRAKRSAIAVEALPGASIFTVRDGRVTRLQLYATSDALLAASGES